MSIRERDGAIQAQQLGRYLPQEAARGRREKRPYPSIKKRARPARTFLEKRLGPLYRRRSSYGCNASFRVETCRRPSWMATNAIISYVASHVGSGAYVSANASLPGSKRSAYAESERVNAQARSQACRAACAQKCPKQKSTKPVYPALGGARSSQTANKPRCFESAARG